MRSTFSILYYINRGKVKADGTTSILCRITIDGKKSVFSTGYYCNPDSWNAKSGEVKDIRTNNLLIALRAKIETSYENLLKETGMVTAEMLKNEITCVATIPTTLLKAGEEERERLRIRAEVIDSTSSYRQSKSSQAYLHEYLLSLSMRDIAFEDITDDFGWGYKLYLKTKGCGASHINHCLTWLNRLMYIAVDREIIRFNPLADVSYEKKPDNKLKHISRAELQRIMEQPMPEKRQELTRRIFIFSGYTGLAFIDVQQLAPEHIVEDSNGNLWIRKPRQKTKNMCNIPLLDIPLEILRKYAKHPACQKKNRLLPVPCNQKMNSYLKEIADLCLINKTLTTHVARHNELPLNLKMNRLQKFVS